MIFRRFARHPRSILRFTLNLFHLTRGMATSRAALTHRIK
jgi:hypothetical protein